jgi:hypothetical protein
MDLDLARERGLLLPAQGPAGHALIKDKDEDENLVQDWMLVEQLFLGKVGCRHTKGLP